MARTASYSTTAYVGVGVASRFRLIRSPSPRERTAVGFVPRPCRTRSARSPAMPTRPAPPATRRAPQRGTPQPPPPSRMIRLRVTSVSRSIGAVRYRRDPNMGRCRHTCGRPIMRRPIRQVEPSTTTNRASSRPSGASSGTSSRPGSSPRPSATASRCSRTSSTRPRDSSSSTIHAPRAASPQRSGSSSIPAATSATRPRSSNRRRLRHEPQSSSAAARRRPRSRVPRRRTPASDLDALTIRSTQSTGRIGGRRRQRRCRRVRGCRRRRNLDESRRVDRDPRAVQGRPVHDGSPRSMPNSPDDPGNVTLEAQRTAAVSQLVALDTRIEELGDECHDLRLRRPALRRSRRCRRAPSSRNPLRNAAIAMVLGVIAAGAWAWWRSENDQRADDRNTPAAILDAPLLAVVPEYADVGANGPESGRCQPRVGSRRGLPLRRVVAQLRP